MLSGNFGLVSVFYQNQNIWNVAKTNLFENELIIFEIFNDSECVLYTYVGHGVFLVLIFN